MFLIVVLKELNNMKNTILSVFIILSLQNILCAQLMLTNISETKGLSLRGLSVVNDSVFWVSGNKGTVGKTTNGGRTITYQQIKGYENTEFRDIEAMDSQTALLMSITEPAHILKTTDGGQHWELVFKNDTPKLFLDAMHLKNNKAVVVGDAVKGKMFLAKSKDYGTTWKVIKKSPKAIENEGCFASSGTNILIHKKGYLFVSGGPNSRLFKKSKNIALPIRQPSETSGANSLAISSNGKNMVIVGGDFNNANETKYTACYSNNNGKTFEIAKKPPTGYRSCVIFINENTLIACGLNGIDQSKDSGKNWENISSKGFHVCQKARNGNSIYLAGSGGRIAKLMLN